MFKFFLNKEERVNRTHLGLFNPKNQLQIYGRVPKICVCHQTIRHRPPSTTGPLKARPKAVNKCMFPQPPLEDPRLCAIRQPEVHTSPFPQPVVTATANSHTHGERILRTRRASGAIWTVRASGRYADHSRDEKQNNQTTAGAPCANALYKESGRGVKFILSYTTPGY